MTTLEEARALVRRRWGMVIDGRVTPSESGRELDVVAPATGEIVATFPHGTSIDVDRAVESAHASFAAWRRVPAIERGRLVSRLADAVEAAGEELAAIDALENGTPLHLLRKDVGLAVQRLRYYAGLALQLRGESIPADGGIDFTRMEPYGVVARLVPFNHPLMFAASGVGAPLVAGNTVVLKPSEHTSLSALRIGELAAEILPAGVVNVVTGLGADVGARLTAHPRVPRVAFTGSVETGLQIQRQAASEVVKVVTLELGGKNPLIVFPDADVHEAVRGAINGMNFTWQGQSCGSTSRLFVHRSLVEQVEAGLSEALNSFVVGDPFDPNSQMGALVSRSHHERVSRFISEGREDPAARVIAGDGELPESGLFVRPTVLSFPDAAHDSRILDTEIFGPVLAVVPFDTYEDVIAHANALPLGLTASVWTSSLDIATAAVRDLEAGYVWVNASSQHIPGAPFGGAKNSGVGREEDLGELYSYAQTKNIFIRTEN
ncbi:aldehyde dehydrogenase family protein [Georgenia sp. Z1491]|uniref:aldehyde dehydrogenase family protein n=1 Tax=Georgenia sp. Z1491 TaxID=3416707 RepID=UPI003CF545B9